MSTKVTLGTVAVHAGLVLVLGLLVLAALSGRGAANGSPSGPPSPTVTAGSSATAAADWPMSADFPPGTIIPNELPGNAFRGWLNNVGGFLGGGELGSATAVWGLVFERAEEDVVVIVMTNSRDSDGNTVDWRVATNLYFAPSEGPRTPISSHECLLMGNPDTIVFARWDGSAPPRNIWLFDDDALTFNPLSAQQVDCVLLMDR